MLNVSQVNHFNYNIGGVFRLPKNALVCKQPATKTQPARFLYVLDVRKCAYQSFSIGVYVPSTGENYTFTGNSNKNAIAAAFARYADSLPLDKIQAPIWPITHKIAMGAGAPHDKKVGQFDSKLFHEFAGRTTETFVTANVKIGSRRYTEEGYWTLL